MKWRKVTPWVRGSLCGQYFVVKHDGFDGEFLYEPTFRPDPRSQPQSIAEYWPRDFKAAALLCEQHQSQLVAA